MTAPIELDAGAGPMPADTSGDSPRVALAIERHADVVRHMRDAHVLWGQMIRAVEAADFAGLEQLSEMHTRSSREAGAAMICLDAIFKSEGVA